MGLMVSEKQSFFFHIISLWELMTLGCGQFGPQALNWQDLCCGPLNIAKYISCGPHGFREEDFLSFSQYKSLGSNDLWGTASLDVRCLVGRIYIGDHLTLLQTKYVSSGPHGFREEDF